MFRVPLILSLSSLAPPCIIMRVMSSYRPSPCGVLKAQRAVMQPRLARSARLQCMAQQKEKVVAVLYKVGQFLTIFDNISCSLHVHRALWLSECHIVVRCSLAVMVMSTHQDACLIAPCSSCRQGRPLTTRICSVVWKMSWASANLSRTRRAVCLGSL